MGYTTPELLQLSRDLTGGKVAEIGDTVLLELLNLEYPKIMNRIYFRDKNYGYDEWKTDLIAGQNSYSMKPVTEVNLAGPTPGIYGQQDIEKIMVKYDNHPDSYYYEAQLLDWDNLHEDRAFYEKRQPRDQPFYILLNGQFLIYPKPKVYVPNGIWMYGTRRPYKLTLDTTHGVGYGGTAEDDLIPDQYQDILAWSIRPHIFRIRKMWNDVVTSTKDFSDKEQDMTYQISIKTTSPVVGLQTDYGLYDGNFGNGFNRSMMRP